MPDFTVILNDRSPYEQLKDLPAWREIERTFRLGSVPHSWAVKSPQTAQSGVLEAMSRMYLCDSGTGDDHCLGCSGWTVGPSGNPVHPDQIVIGEFAKAPNMESCRTLIKDISLKPVLSRRRLGVVLEADKLLMHAANCLLKIAEEPPSHAALLFLFSENELLPTLRSRARLTTLTVQRDVRALPRPGSEEEWIRWLTELKEDSDIVERLSSWIEYALQAKNVDVAARMEKLRLLIEQKKLSHNMVCDLLILSLKEEVPFEYIFGGLW